MIDVKNLKLTFGKQIIFDNFSLNIKKGEKVCLTGESGSGKTTFLNLIEGFIPDYEGEIKIFGKKLNPENIKEIRKNTAWLPQNIFAGEESAMSLFFDIFNFDANKKNKPGKREIIDTFNQFGLEYDILQKKANEISGGQRQRILLASCLLLKKPLLLVDEPTSALDEKIKHKVTDYILNRKNLTVIAATHDEYWIKSSDKVIEL